MVQRCHDPKAENYRYYGAEGVTVCAQWRHSFARFVADLGQCPSAGMTLERLDNSKPYAPGNCRWATRAEQNRNRRSCVLLTHDGRTLILSDWARELGLTPNALRMRLVKLGWSVERALTTPKANLLRKRGKAVKADLTKVY